MKDQTEEVSMKDATDEDLRSYIKVVLAIGEVSDFLDEAIREGLKAGVPEQAFQESARVLKYLTLLEMDLGVRVADELRRRHGHSET